MPNDWSREYHHHIRPIDAPPEASPRERAQFRQNLKRAARLANGRCPYCGRLPEPGNVRCARCLELQRKQNARSAERRRARRDAERRAARPRACPACSGGNLRKRGLRDGRQYYSCRDCGRRSFGDGPPAPRPHYPCPYCGAQCIKRGRVLDVKRKPLRFSCTACGRKNTNLWPEDTPSPGGPFPHEFCFNLNYPARDALLIYCQEKKRSVAQAIREIFIEAAKVPPLHAAVGRPGSASQSPAIRAYLAAAEARAHPAPPLPIIPPDGLRLPSACPDATAKLAKMRTGCRYNPTVLVAYSATVCLNDLALASLLEMMRRRNLNHQDTARALIAESTRPHTSLIGVCFSICTVLWAVSGSFAGCPALGRLNESSDVGT